MGWKAVINIISDKYRPSETVYAVLALLTECGGSDTDFFDKKVDSETEDELKSVGEKYSIDCQVQSKTIRQYYDFIIARMNQTTRECEALENSTSIYSEEFTIPALATFVVLVGVFVFVQCVPAIGKSNTDSDKIQTESQNSYDSSESETVSEDSASKYPSTSDSSESKSSVWLASTSRNDVDYKNLPEYQVLESKVDSYSDIYTLGNAIPCGLVNYNVSYGELVALRDYTKETDNILVYGDYSLYGYNHCRIWYLFDDNNILDEIDVFSPYIEGKVTFTRDDIEQIGHEIEGKLGVSPRIGHFEGTQYTFTKDGVQYHMDTYASRADGKTSNEFCLKITAAN